MTFRAEVNYVEVDARVLDATAKFIAGLGRQGLPGARGRQAAAGHDLLARQHAGRARRAPAVRLEADRAGREDQPGRPDGRVYLIVLDDLHTKALRSTRVKAAARQFIERYVGANDLVAVVHTSGRTNAGQEFTSNQRLLLRRSTSSWAASSGRRTLNKIDDEQR